RVMSVHCRVMGCAVARVSARCCRSFSRPAVAGVALAWMGGGSRQPVLYSRAMCGINGIFAYGADAPNVDRDELIVSRETMRPRGPDAEGVWLSNDERVGLAHRRLSIIDLSPAGAQPMHRGALSIIFNGEIYNYQEL